MEGKEDTAQLRVLSSRRVTRRLDYKSSMGFLSSSGGGRNTWKQEIYQHNVSIRITLEHGSMRISLLFLI